MNPARVWGVLVLLSSVLACGGGGDATGTPPRQTPNPNPNPGGSTSSAIDVRDNSFNPNSTTVAPGTTVTWTWRGVALHDVSFNDGPTSAQQTSGTFSREFAAAGTYGYHCRVHGTAMSGSVVVR